MSSTRRFTEGYSLLNSNVKTNIGPIDIDKSSQDAGAVPAAVAAYIAATEYGDESFHKTMLTCVGLPISLADDNGVAQYGGVQIYTFPKGVICTLGASNQGTLTLGTTGTVIAGFTGVNALGVATAGTGATLATTEATWLQSTANATAAAKVAAIKSFSIATQLTESPGRVYDGSTTAAPVFLNFAIADDATHTAMTGTFTGVITILWCNLMED